MNVEKEIDSLIKDAYLGFESAINAAQKVNDSKERNKILTRAEFEGLELVMQAIDKGYVPGTRKISHNETRDCMEDPGHKLIYLVALRRELGNAVRGALSGKDEVRIFKPLPENSNISDWTIYISRELEYAASRYGLIMHPELAIAD